MATQSLHTHQQIAVLYVVVGLIGVMFLVFLTPPFQIPDEHQHFSRAYQIFELSLRVEIMSTKTEGSLPSTLAKLTERFLGSLNLHSLRNVTPSPFKKTFEAMSITLEPLQREFLNFNGAAFYFPLPYLPQAIVIAVRREVGSGPLGLLYSARLANGAVAVLFVASAIRMMQVGNFLLFVTARALERTLTQNNQAWFIIFDSGPESRN